MPQIFLSAYDKNRFINPKTDTGASKMENNEIMPIKLQMALAHNQRAFSTFLRMDDNAQKKIIESAKNIKTVREINIFVDLLLGMD